MPETDLSEAAIRASCPHCDPGSHTFKFQLAETEQFRIVCDRNPLIEGHILIIPKEHRACIAEYTAEEFIEYEQIAERTAGFVAKTYGSVSIFEHGRFGQTVFHSHVHLLPFAGNPVAIIPEGEDRLEPLKSLKDLHARDERDDGYLYFDIEGEAWTVDVKLAAPRFFRDRFGAAVGHPERGNWKALQTNPHAAAELASECEALAAKWRAANPLANL